MQRSLAERLLADTAPEGRAALLEQLIDEFEAHGAAEEQTIFADLLGHPAARIPEHVAQHDQASELLLKLKEADRSEEHTSELQSLMRISYAVFCLKKKNKK